MDNILLYSKLSNLPDSMKSEVSNFIDFLVTKNKKSIKQKPKFGSAKGMFKMKKNFDDPIGDFNTICIPNIVYKVIVNNDHF